MYDLCEMFVQGQTLTVGAAFTVCMRLTGSESCPFLVPAKKYTDSSVAFSEGTIVRAVSAKTGLLEDPSTPGYRYVSDVLDIRSVC
jgi:hypothetical protein